MTDYVIIKNKISVMLREIEDPVFTVTEGNTPETK